MSEPLLVRFDEQAVEGGLSFQGTLLHHIEIRSRETRQFRRSVQHRLCNSRVDAFATPVEYLIAFRPTPSRRKREPSVSLRDSRLRRSDPTRMRRRSAIAGG